MLCRHHLSWGFAGEVTAICKRTDHITNILCCFRGSARAAALQLQSMILYRMSLYFLQRHAAFTDNFRYGDIEYDIEYVLRRFLWPRIRLDLYWHSPVAYRIDSNSAVLCVRRSHMPLVTLIHMWISEWHHLKDDTIDADSSSNFAVKLGSGSGVTKSVKVTQLGQDGRKLLGWVKMN